jgi:branched-chain amino acid transport system ATP-binding protein
MLKLSNVTVRFGGLVANDDISFEVEKDCIFGLIGPNGAGKTTLFNVISGVYKPTAGEIRLSEKRIDGLLPYQINRVGITRTYQNIQLFRRMSVLDNVKVGCMSRSSAGLFSAILRTPAQKREEKAITEKCMDILKFLEIDKFADHAANSLSYGQQRRVEIARALAGEPKLLLLDEPAAGMNSGEKRNLSDVINKINKEMGMTILIVEHDMKIALNITHTVCVLNYGKQIALGAPEEIQNNPEVIDAYLGGEIDV